MLGWQKHLLTRSRQSCGISSCLCPVERLRPQASPWGMTSHGSQLLSHAAVQWLIIAQKHLHNVLKVSRSAAPMYLGYYLTKDGVLCNKTKKIVDG
jgi:hypothetical protein